MNYAVIISGSGSNLQAFIDASQSGQLDARLALVISNRADAYGLQRAAQAGIATVTVDHREYGQREDFDRALLQAIAPHGVDLIIGSKGFGGTVSWLRSPLNPRDLESWMRSRVGDDPYGELIGDLKPRGGPNGLVLRHGYIIAEWGNTRRVDVTYSVTKSFSPPRRGLPWRRA